ncbi:unnamed protein product [Vitrella brassicaformis CCMP3155]|uniref:Uncharacterized protein n=1 Tax=Vitrella brassicaformis (strain CCMP3155) TaxID=1169540 RepID=A0A0G4G6J6_VITBC|nr:unnamed protein product [Vitrella brassicaformis CCMP3155]|eukprot:CEM24175.1 unnamed protein product [Vitrella brassicaformis CCMP3155]
MEADAQGTRTDVPRGVLRVSVPSILWRICGYLPTRKRLTLRTLCGTLKHAVCALVCIIANSLLPQGQSSSSHQEKPGAQQAIVVLPAKVAAVRDEVYETNMGRLLRHRETLKEIRITQLRPADGEKAEQQGTDADMTQIEGDPTVFPSVTSLEVDSVEALVMLHRHKCVFPALRRISGRLIPLESCNIGMDSADHAPLEAINVAALDTALSRILGSSPRVEHLDIFPIALVRKDKNHSLVEGPGARLVMEETVTAVRSLRRLCFLGHLLLDRGACADNPNQPTNLPMETARSLVQHLSSPSPGTGIQGHSPAAAKKQLHICCPIEIHPGLPHWLPDSYATPASTARFTPIHLIRLAEERGCEVIRDGGTTHLRSVLYASDGRGPLLGVLQRPSWQQWRASSATPREGPR